jgi:hypothetical protein
MQPTGTTKTYWTKVRAGDIIYSQDGDSWKGPLFVEDPLMKIVTNINTKERDVLDDSITIVRVLINKDKADIYDPEEGGLKPLPGWVSGQEHQKNPILLKSFTEKDYLEAKNLVEKNFWTSEEERISRTFLKDLWEKALNSLERDGRKVKSIDLHPGGMVRVSYES